MAVYLNRVAKLDKPGTGDRHLTKLQVVVANGEQLLAGEAWWNADDA